MTLVTFAPNTKIASSDVNSNFSACVTKTDQQVVTNKVNIPSYTTLSPSIGGTVNLDLSLYNWFTINMPAGNATLAIVNATVGQPFVIEILQDGVGGRTITWFTTIKWINGSAPVLSTGASKKDTLGLKVTSIGNYEGYIVGTNI